MNWHRIHILILSDLRFSVFRMKGLVFLIPYLFFWYWIFKLLNGSGSEMLTSVQSIALLSWLYEPEIANKLLISHPPSLSLFFLVSLTTVPFFAMLSGHNQFAGDIGKQTFRYFLTRTTRFEIFISRIGAHFILFGLATLLTTILATWISFKNDNYTLDQTLDYAIHIQLMILVYLLPFVAYMSVISAVMSSAMSSLLMSMIIYVLLMVAGNYLAFYTATSIALVPGSIRDYLIGIDPHDLQIACAASVGYTLVFASMGWMIFRKRNI